jgi:NAD(P)-dependent dehydrogenase (short-subunit alcohol dehydrogenase family)
MTSDSEMLDVTGRVAMISGASRGIGAAIATRLLDDGYRVSLGVRNVPFTRKAFAGYPPEKLLIESFDAADPATAERWIESTMQYFGELHALVNNAGIYRLVNYEEGSDADLDDLWEVNVKAPFRLTRLAMPALKQCGNGRIVNVASTDGLRFRDNSASVGYTMSKHALVAMTHAARQFGYADGVRATALCPGAVDTDMVAGLASVTPAAGRLAPGTVAGLVATVLSLPNNASVALLPVNTRAESTL